MHRILLAVALAPVFIACSDTTGLKPPSAKNSKIEVVSMVSRTSLGVGDTATFSYSLKNLTTDTLTLTTDTGCQVRPELDQVAGPRMTDLLTLSCPPTPTVRKLAPGEKQTYGIFLRGFDKTKAATLQTPGYLLTTGTFDASMVVVAKELGAPVRSDWVRFTVK